MRLLSGRSRPRRSGSGHPTLQGLDQGQRVLSKQGAVIDPTGMQELGFDAIVKPDPVGHILDMGLCLLAQIGDLVDEGDLGRVKWTGSTFGELSHAPPS
jgi:hypothetical protein